MRKIPSLFKRDYEGTRQVYDEAVPGSEWVLAGEGIATLKIDGTCCKVEDGRLFKRYDRKLNKVASRARKKGSAGPWAECDFKPAPIGWMAAEPEPNLHTGHWPGWLEVGDGPEDRWHREAIFGNGPEDGTYELMGPKVQGNPYGLERHVLCEHGMAFREEHIPPRNFEGLRMWMGEHVVEGVVWHHQDGRMVKIKRKDFGLAWPCAGAPWGGLTV